jgi:hypothetical protein
MDARKRHTVAADEALANALDPSDLNCEEENAALPMSILCLRHRTDKVS